MNNLCPGTEAGLKRKKNNNIMLAELQVVIKNSSTGCDMTHALFI